MDISYLVANSKDSNGEFTVRLDKMYDKLIQPLDMKYANQSLVNKRRVICPFHDDIKPSLGMIHSRNNGMPLFHCFGCGVKGNVVHFYIFYNRKYKDRELTTEEATIELAEKFDIELGDNLYQEMTKSIEEKKLEIISKPNEYTIRDYESDCRNIGVILDNSKEEFASYVEELQLHWANHRGF